MDKEIVLDDVIVMILRELKRQYEQNYPLARSYSFEIEFIQDYLNQQANKNEKINELKSER